MGAEQSSSETDSEYSDTEKEDEPVKTSGAGELAEEKAAPKSKPLQTVDFGSDEGLSFEIVLKPGTSMQIKGLSDDLEKFNGQRCELLEELENGVWKVKMGQQVCKIKTENLNLPPGVTLSGAKNSEYEEDARQAQEDAQQTQLSQLPPPKDSAADPPVAQPKPAAVASPRAVIQDDEDHTAEEHKLIVEPYEYLKATGGKKIRSKIIQCFQDAWFKVDPVILQTIKDVVEMLHTASLMLDDIEDDSKLRRGQPVTHAVFGVPSTLNSANYMIFIALQKIQGLNNPKATERFVGNLLDLHRGQGMDIWWRDNHTCPTMSQYKSMVKNKTGGLLRLAVDLLFCFSDNNVDLTELVNTIGLWYQIRDDYLSLKNVEHMRKKEFCEDIREGKYSFPIIHAMQKNPNDHRLANILKQGTSDPDITRHAVSYIELCGSFDYTRKTLSELQKKIEASISKFGGNRQLAMIVKQLGQTIDSTTKLLQSVEMGRNVTV